METILRASSIYVFLLVLFRIVGRRSVSEMTQFDFVLVLILGEATQQALLGDDYSVINSVVVVGTLLGLDLLISHLKYRHPAVDRWLDGVPVILVHNGQPQAEAMDRELVDMDELVETARQVQGLEKLEQVKQAVLEKSGKISIVPREEDAA